MTQPSPLDNLQVAAPCHADWEKMRPLHSSSAVRHCQSCNKNVYNVSLISRAEAEDLLLKHEGKLCVRFARRADGTLVTGDCPAGRSIKKRRRGWALAALLAAFIPSPVSALLKRASAATLRTVPAISALEKTPNGERFFLWLDPPSQPPRVFKKTTGCD